MELVDRYLKTVGSYLPAAQKEDILKELSENIRSNIEDREAAVGRPLSESEAVLKQHGHPLLVAGRYRQDHRTVAFGHQWIGPVLFPFYTKGLSFNLGVSFTVVFTVFVALYACEQSPTLWNVASAFFLQLIIQFSIVTFIFAMLDKQLTRFPEQWDPRKLTQFKYPGFPQGNAAGKGQRVRRLESISQFIASAVFLAWLRAAQRSPFLIFGPAAAVFRLAPVWHQVYAPSVLIVLLGMAQAGINVLRPDWTRFRYAARVGTGAITLIVVYFLVRAHEWIILASPAGTASGNHSHAMEIINQWIFYSLLLTALIAILLLLRNFWRLFRVPQARAAAKHSLMSL